MIVAMVVFVVVATVHALIFVYIANYAKAGKYLL